MIRVCVRDEDMVDIPQGSARARDPRGHRGPGIDQDGSVEQCRGRRTDGAAIALVGA